MTVWLNAKSKNARGGSFANKLYIYSVAEQTVWDIEHEFAGLVELWAKRKWTCYSHQL